MVARGGGRSPFAVTLTASQRRFLKRLVRRPTVQQRQVTRARIVLGAAAGLANAAIARKLGIAPNSVGKWRKRFCLEGVDGLADRKRSGRPRAFPAAVVAYAKAVACELPRTRGVPLSRPAAHRRSCAGTGPPRRWPWQHRSWIFPRDPNLAAKATVVVDLYQRSFAGVPLGAGDHVISADEKTSIQARCRCHPTLPPGRARSMRV